MKFFIVLLLFVFNAQASLFITPDSTNSKSLTSESKFLIESIPIKFKFNHQEINDKLVLDLKLTEEIQVKAIRFKIEKQSPYTIWTGKISNDPYGKLIIVYNQDSVAIELSAGGNHYWLMQKEDGYHLVQSIPLDRSAVVKKAQDYIDAKNIHTDNYDKAQVTTKSSDKFIDVMLLYTDDVKAYDTNVETVLTARMASVNQVLEDSCVNFRYRTVHMAQMTHTEAGDTTSDLNCIYEESDGCLDNIHTLRETHGADLYQMNTQTGDVCGLAHLGSLGYMRDDVAASITIYHCGANTMAHEFGHNLGLQHDRYQKGYKPRQYLPNTKEGFGWVDMINKQKSIMSYSDQCADNGITCRTIGQFSNSSVKHKGIPFGEAGFSDSSQFMNKYYAYMANFRDSKTSYSPNINKNCIASGDEKDVHCFVATAAFGSYMQEDVLILRQFRDKFLKTNSIGQKFVDIYYEYSPYMAHYISKNLFAKSISKNIIKGISFIVKNILDISIIFVTLLAFKLFGMKALLLGVIIFSLNQQAKADVAVPSLFSNYQSVNPASRFLVTTPMMLALNYEKIEKVGEANNMEFKTEGSQIDLLFGVYSQQFFFDFAFYNKSRLTESIASKGLSDVESDIEKDELRLQVGSVFMLTGPLGVKYHSKKIVDSDDYKTKELVTLGLGSVSYWNGFRLGYGFDLIEEKGESIADAKWLDIYFAFAGGSFSGGGGTVFEYAFHRSPKVVATDNTIVNVHPETWSHLLIYEMAAPLISFINLNKFRASLKLEQQKTVDVYYEDPVNTTELGVRFGGTLFQTTNYNLGYTLAKSDNTSEDQETRIKLGLYWGLGGAGAVAAE